MKVFVIAIFFSLFLLGCSEKEEYIERPVEILYNSAMDFFEKEDYKKSAKAFGEVERQHPYSNWAVKAQLMSAYSFYACKMYEEAIEGFRTFIQLHPGHDNVDYANYVLALCYYEQIPAVERDQKPSEEALSTFMEIINRFPNSIYAKDAKYKTDMIRSHLAAKEVQIGRYYQNQGTYLAAIKRFKTVVESYSSTVHVAESLHRLIECYVALGLKDAAQETASILGHNYPKSSWYKESFDLLKSHNIK